MRALRYTEITIGTRPRLLSRGHILKCTKKLRRLTGIGMNMDMICVLLPPSTCDAPYSD